MLSRQKASITFINSSGFTTSSAWPALCAGTASMAPTSPSSTSSFVRRITMWVCRSWCQSCQRKFSQYLLYLLLQSVQKTCSECGCRISDVYYTLDSGKVVCEADYRVTYQHYPLLSRTTLGRKPWTSARSAPDLWRASSSSCQARSTIPSVSAARWGVTRIKHRGHVAISHSL